MIAVNQFDLVFEKESAKLDFLETVDSTMVDQATGTLKMKKGEAWINFFFSPFNISCPV